MTHRALVLCNGEPPSRRLVHSVASRVDLVVAADGGANIARRLGIRPHVIIGDFDSIKSATRRFFASSLIIHVGRQDNTDLEKALDYVQEAGMTNVMVLGLTGKRIDFTLANLSVLWKYSSSLEIGVMGDGWRGILVRAKTVIRARRGTTVSLLPFGICRGISVRGLKYPLTDASMRVGEIGVSNVVTRPPVTVSVRRGKMMVFVMDTR